MKYTLHILLTVCAFSVIMPPSNGEGETANNHQVAVPQEGTTEEDKKKEIDEGLHVGEEEKDKKSLVAEQQTTDIKEENNTKDNDKGSHGEEKEDTMLKTMLTSLNEQLKKFVEKNNITIHECSHGKEEKADNPQVAVPQKGTTEEYKKKETDEGSHGGEEDKKLLQEQMQKFKQDICIFENYESEIEEKTKIENKFKKIVIFIKSFIVFLEVKKKDLVEMQHLMEEIQRETEEKINNEGENKETKSKYTERQNGITKVKQLIKENIEKLENRLKYMEIYQGEIEDEIKNEGENIETKSKHTEHQNGITKDKKLIDKNKEELEKKFKYEKKDQGETEKEIKNEGENKETKSKYTKRQNCITKVKKLIEENIEELEKILKDEEKDQGIIMNQIKKLDGYSEKLKGYIIRTESALKYVDENKVLPEGFKFISEDREQQMQINIDNMIDILDNYINVLS